jgi:hypothetical protein
LHEDNAAHENCTRGLVEDASKIYLRHIKGSK